MSSAAPASKLTLSGRANSVAGSQTARSAYPPSTLKPATRSPVSTRVPATSLPGTNGSSGFIWYSPRLISTSGKFTPAMCTSTRTPAPGSGSGTSTSCTAFGPSREVTWIARMHRTLAMSLEPPERRPEHGLSFTFARGSSWLRGRASVATHVGPADRVQKRRSAGMTTYLLLHGAGSDGWYWHRVLPLLPDAVAPDLPVTDDEAGFE